jgi:four helix bundle protein
MNSESPLLVISKKYAVDVLNLCEGEKFRSVVTTQLIKSATSIGANIREANYAHSKADFVSKLEIALKECFESEYWLELLVATKKIGEEAFNELMKDAGAMRRMLIASCKTAKSE